MSEEKITKQVIEYCSHPLKEPWLVNDREWSKIVISSHYEANHSEYMNDELILKLAQQLAKGSFIPKLQGQLADGTTWESFAQEPLWQDDKAYRLVWYWELNKPNLWIINCHRRKKYERK